MEVGHCQPQLCHEKYVITVTVLLTAITPLASNFSEQYLGYLSWLLKWPNVYL